MKSAESAIRISGTLRRKVDESIEKKIVSKVLILLVINYCYYQIYYKTNTESGVKLYLDFIKEYVIIWERHETDSVKDTIKLIQEVVKSNYEKSKKHLISYKQFIDINNMMCNVDYSYQENYIKTILFKMVGRIDKGALSKNDLKMYILENEKIEFILEEIGCKKIRYISNTKGDDYYKCTNPDGNNPEAIRVYLNEYLNVTDYTRNLGDVADIYTLVQYSKKYSFSQTLVYLNQLLGLTKLSETELRMLSIQTDNKKTEIKKRSTNKKGDEAARRTTKISNSISKRQVFI